MKKIILFILFQITCATGFSENPRWKEFGTPIPAHANLDVRWEAPTKTFPSKVWVYRLLPNRWSPEIISRLTACCSFTGEDKAEQNANGMMFRSRDGSRRLSISFSFGTIDYETAPHYYMPTNLAKDVPEMSRMPELTTNFLQSIGIRLSDIEKNTNGTPAFGFWQPLTLFFDNGATITNIGFRAVSFRRSADGLPFVGDKGGDCAIQFGEHGQISKIHLSWPNLERQKSYSTVTRKTAMKYLREGKAVQGLLPIDFGDFDWNAVKSVTIKKAWPSYYAGNSDWLYPYLALWTTVDSGHGNVDVEIDCPIIDEAKTAALR
jgi:hypothetical protein